MGRVSDESSSTERLLSIGVFSRRSRLSPKALRLYDRQGLLSPAYVDPHNGYRWYHESQLFAARLIGLLRQLEMPLARVTELVAASGEQGVELLDAYWSEIERRFAGQRQLVGLLRTSLSGGEERFGGFDISERDVPEQLVLHASRHLELPELSDWLRATERALTAAAEEYGGPAGGGFVIFHGQVDEENDGPVEVCVPIRSDAASDRPTVRLDPAHREAYVTVTKAQFEMPQVLSAYDAVARWITTSGRTITGPPREVYFPGVDPHTAKPSDLVCDIAFPMW